MVAGSHTPWGLGGRPHKHDTGQHDDGTGEPLAGALFLKPKHAVGWKRMLMVFGQCVYRGQAKSGQQGEKKPVHGHVPLDHGGMMRRLYIILPV